MSPDDREAAEAPPAVDSSRAVESRTTPARPVLVVDDDAFIRETVGEILALEGYSVVQAGDGAEALNVIERMGHPPAAIFLDMRMPVLDGWGFAAEYRRRPGPHAEIVVMTAARDAHAWATEVGAAGTLAKPFNLDALLDMAERFAGPCDAPYSSAA
jgi:two-component system, chemotaxis family, chemotaxis protein CheY